MKLYEAFNIMAGDVVAFIGAGGKTSTLLNLGHELAEMGWRVLATTTTSIEEDQLGLLPRAIAPDAGSDVISQALSEDGFVFLYDKIKGGAVYGPQPSWIPHLMDAVDSDVLLIEADAANRRPLKAPFSHEPVIPPETSLVIQVASMAAIGQPLDEEHIYNAQAIIERYGFPEGGRIRSPWLAQVIRDEALGLRNVPEGARTVAFLNRVAPQGNARTRARLIARIALRTRRLHSVVIGSERGGDPVYEVQRPMAAVIMAAGSSTGMDTLKTLMPWGDSHTAIEHIIQRLQAARLDAINVVVGHQAQQVKDAIAPYGVNAVYNRSYKSGDMLSSLKIGLRTLPDNIAAALLVLGDQPQLQSKVLYQLLNAYAENNDQIIVPSYRARHGYPIIIGRRHWGDIYNLPRSESPRTFMNAHANHIRYVNVDSDSILTDMDATQGHQARRRGRSGF